jgi:hypothetical protein
MEEAFQSVKVKPVVPKEKKRVCREVNPTT